MEIKIVSNITNESIIIPTFLDNENKHVDKNYKKILNKVMEEKKFKAEKGQITCLNLIDKDKLKSIVFLGLGKEDLVTNEMVKKYISKALRKLNELKEKEVSIVLFKSKNICIKQIVKAIAESAFLTEYKFQKYISNKKQNFLKKINILLYTSNELDFKDAKLAILEGKIMANSVILTRDLINEPANILYPTELGKRAENIGKEYGFEVEVLNKDEIEKLKMDAFLSVAQGSKREPQLIVMRYFGDKGNKEVLGLVGKGLTYDSGGYSLKSSDGMVSMKTDMAGAAAVIGAISAIAKNNLKANVIGVIAACENMLSGDSYKPGDIINSMGGKTIEVLNTDCEGRLTLIDAVYYAIHKEKVTKIVDIATLTGAAVVALGSNVTGVITNDKEFLNNLKEASRLSGEKIWQLPSFEEYKEGLKSEVADFKNTSGRYAGAITAGLFIGEFVDNTPWIHMDIAGTSTNKKDEYYFSKGATGVGVNILYYLAKILRIK